MAQPLKRLSLNIQTFEKLIDNNSIYVDKTDQIYNLLTTSGSTYFLSRPRRFGKSLLVSTLEAIFQGRKELFEGLAISQTDYTWPVHPVIRLDFSSISHETSDELERGLCNELFYIGELYGLNLKDHQNSTDILKTLIRKLSEKNKVVILIDEYDKPILDHIHNPDAAEKNQSVLRNFFTTMKALDQHIRFIFLTGITKFTKTSIFSSLNNLNDISEKEIGAYLVGYTQEEIKHFFPVYLELAAQHQNTTIGQLLAAIKEWYDGYWFCTDLDPDGIYSPLSVMYFLQDKKFKNYWINTATPSHLVELMRLKKYNLSKLEEFKPLIVGSDIFLSCDLSGILLEALLYQAGYLTIQSFDQEAMIASLDFPNKEVRDSMRILLISMKSGISTIDVKPTIENIKNGFLNHDISAVVQGLQIMVAQIPSMNHIEDESYYHSLFQMILITIGFRVESEPNTHTGRPDLVVDTGKQIFVIELKLNKTQELALDQITKKRYYEKFRIENKPITLVGINFEYKEKRVAIQHVVKTLD